MDELTKAAFNDSIESLHRVLEQDPTILDRLLASSSSKETPLHLAAMWGKANFVKEITRIKPQLALKLDGRRFTPLHAASVRGRVEAIKALLAADGGSKACFIRCLSFMTPLLLTALGGHLEAFKLLLRAEPETTALDRCNIAHACVIYNQLELVKFLIAESPEFLNSKDADGNTPLHLAAATKHIEITEYLLGVAGVDAYAINNEGMTPRDVLFSRRPGMNDEGMFRLFQQLIASTRRSSEPVPAQIIPSTTSRDGNRSNHSQGCRRRKRWNRNNTIAF